MDVPIVYSGEGDHLPLAGHPTPRPTHLPETAVRSPRPRPRTRTPRRLRTALAVATVVASVGACTSDRADGPGSDGAFPRFELASALQPFNACSDLLDYLHAEATKRVTAYGLPGLGGGVFFGGARDVMETAAPATTAAAMGGFDESTKVAQSVSAAETSGSGGGGFSTTNTVEAGVDEPDIVKTDGKLLVTVVGNQVHVLDVTGAEPVLRSTLDVPGYPSQLLLSGTRLLVLGMAVEEPMPQGGGAVGKIMPVYGTQRGAIIEVDLADPAAPKVVRQLQVDGMVNTARVVGGVARVVVQSTPDGLDFVQPSGPNAEQRAKDMNAEIVRESTIGDWLPSYRLLDAAGKELGSGQLSECNQISRPPTFHGFSTTSVLTLDLGKGLEPTKAAAVLADGQRVYASKDNLYLAIGRWEDPAMPVGGDEPATTVANTSLAPDGSSTTAIHQFSTPAGEAATYVATGEVQGQLMNDFSMSEHNGVLRVATTDGSPWAMPMTESGEGGPTSQSRVTVLRRDGSSLGQVGLVDGLGKGEQIYGVRFVGDVGYVVTFRQTDPLYVVDLSTPESPKVTGELKILGYSAYLHDLGNGRLLGVGQDATEQGRRLGAQVSLFDVSNPAAPTRIAQYTLPNGWTNAEGDYKAFLWWAPTGLVMLPMQTFDPTSGVPFSGAIGLTVDDATITELARVSHPAFSPCDDQPGIEPLPAPATTLAPAAPDSSSSSAGAASAPSMGIAPGYNPDCASLPGYTPMIMRSVVVGSSVFTVSERGVMASDLTTLSQAAWVPFG